MTDAVREVAMLVNPAAGRGRARRAADEAAARLVERGVSVTELVGVDAAHTAALARSVVSGAGADAALVVVGGDGIVSVAWAAVAGTDVPLGLIPAGTGDDHARAFGLPRRSASAAADVIADGVSRKVDLGRVVTADGLTHWYGSVLAAGFDSLVSERANQLRWPRGRARYPLATLIELGRLRPTRLTLTVDGESADLDVLLVAVGNTETYGGGMRICPDADPADGLLDVTVVAAAPRRRVLLQLQRVYRGTHVLRPEVQTRRARTVRLSAPGVVAYADGERLGSLPVDVDVVRAAARLLVPGRVRDGSAARP